ncbi:TerC family protein [Pseudidiomarina sediminum]|uniref:TerC family protein n=1 Tax=Pseudidiomarina sediminum TaxID=431675 RepID=UPI001C988FD4|nr:TerC family protein [Pseudidiomarina sediminum]MBY6064881.1 TerC family protein [Pseudidiomarina sediminum]
MFEWIFLPEAWIALATLTALEVVLGIDNIIFISILVGRLPAHQRHKARQLGLLLAMGMRILLLLSIVWVMGLTEPLFSVFDFSFSGRDLILFFGGLFLLGKSTLEIHHSLEGVEEHHSSGKAATFGAIIAQIAVIDIVFSLDSVITAVGLVDYVAVMIIAVVIAVLVMMLAAKAIGDFVDRHPTIKMLALSFLILIGFTLMGEGLGFHVPKGYVYFAMAFSLLVELLNIRVRKRAQNRPVQLKKRMTEEPSATRSE